MKCARLQSLRNELVLSALGRGLGNIGRTQLVEEGSFAVSDADDGVAA